MIKPLNLPKADLNLTRKNGDVYVWSILRKKQLKLTPEEWVRQHFVHYLLNEYKLPIGLLVEEYSLVYNGLSKRADILLFNQKGVPKVLVECKSTDVELSQDTFYQVAQYSKSLNVDLCILTNGLQHIFLKSDNNDFGASIIDESEFKSLL